MNKGALGDKNRRAHGASLNVDEKTIRNDLNAENSALIAENSAPIDIPLDAPTARGEADILEARLAQRLEDEIVKALCVEELRRARKHRHRASAEAIDGLKARRTRQLSPKRQRSASPIRKVWEGNFPRMDASLRC